jgi:AcrR family transcriptional regulator
MMVRDHGGQVSDRGRRVRADAERSVRNILEAAERILSVEPTATMEQIAAAAGVARTTIHRHFANRDALLTDMARAAWRQIQEAIEQARPATAPPLVALHQATANILRIKSGWSFALGHHPADEATTQIQNEVFAACDTVFKNARHAGIIGPDTDLAWTRQVYLALINETAHGASGNGMDPDALAARIIDTLLYGTAHRTIEHR